MENNNAAIVTLESLIAKTEEDIRMKRVNLITLLTARNEVSKTVSIRHLSNDQFCDFLNEVPAKLLLEVRNPRDTFMRDSIQLREGVEHNYLVYVTVTTSDYKYTVHTLE